MRNVPNMDTDEMTLCAKSRSALKMTRWPNLVCQQKPALDRQERSSKIKLSTKNKVDNCPVWLGRFCLIREFKWFLNTWTLEAQYVDEAPSIVLGFQTTFVGQSNGVNFD